MRVLTSLSIDTTNPEALRFYHEELGATVVVHLGDSATLPKPANGIEGGSADTSQAQAIAWNSSLSEDVHPISIATSTSEEGERLFSALSAEGSMTASEEPQFTSTDLGTLVDKFGTHWDCYSDDIA